MCGSRGGGGQGVPTPLKNHKYRVSPNTGPDHLKNHKAAKPAPNVGPASARQRNAISFPGGEQETLFRLRGCAGCSALLLFICDKEGSMRLGHIILIRNPIIAQQIKNFIFIDKDGK